MILLFKLVIISFILVMGLKVSTSQGMIFEKIGDYARKKVDEGYRAWDLIACEWCCGTWLSIVAHFFAIWLGILKSEWNWQLLIRWPLVVCCTSIMSGIVWTIYLTLNQIKEKNQAEVEYLKYIDIDSE